MTWAIFRTGIPKKCDMTALHCLLEELKATMLLTRSFLSSDASSQDLNYRISIVVIG